MGFKRNHLQGTELDMSKDAGAGPFGLPYRWRGLTWKNEDKEYFNERATVTQQTGFSFIAQMRNWLPDPIGGINWFGVDDAGSTVYVPFYCGINSYSRVMPDIQKVQCELETKFAQYTPAIDAAALSIWKDNPKLVREFLTDYSCNMANSTVKKWKELCDFLLVKYLDGNLKQEKDGEFLRNPWGYPQPPSFPGYSEQWKENVIKDTGDRFLYQKK